MRAYAIIKAGKVENVIEYDAQPTTPPPGFGDGYAAVQADAVSPGWLYENGAFVDTTPPAEPIVLPLTPDYSNSDNLDKTLKALALCIAQVGGLKNAQMKALFKQKFDLLP